MLIPLDITGESATAIRDPAFYRWHVYIDKYFQIHKEKIAPYNKQQIGYDQIAVSSVEIQSEGKQSPNTFFTFWQQSDVDLTRGMDFLPRVSTFAR